MATAILAAPKVRPKSSADERLMGAAAAVMLLVLALIIVLPLWALLSKSVQDQDGRFIGLVNFVTYFSTPSLVAALWNSLFVAVATTVIVLPLAFVYAYALTRSCMRLRGLFGAIALLPILAPSLMPALSLIYLFGNQGMLRPVLMGHSVYGPIGIIIAEVIYCFPFALMILVTALSIADARLYEAARALRASPSRIFFTVTLPGAWYGVVGAAFVVLTLTVTDFGIPKVIGGRFDVLATDVYKQVIGQFNFQMGAVVGLILLTPAVLSFFVDRFVQRRQVALLSARAVPLQPAPSARFDWIMFAFCALVALLLLGFFGIAVWASLIKLWPYNLSLTLDNYQFANFDAAGWDSYWNSIRMAAWTAVIGTAVVFVGAWLIEKGRRFRPMLNVIQFVAMLPMAVPGLVIGIGYIFFFNNPGNPLGFLYGTAAILVVNSIAHFYTVGHLTATTALKQMDPEFEAVSASLKVPIVKTFMRVTVPVCLPAIFDIAIYLFLNAMTTVSAVIFLYGSETKLASIAVVNMDEAGMQSAAAAMATMIMLTSAVVKGLQVVIGRGVIARTQAWRRR
jgi:iron(III) transport system permease protein